MVYIRTGCLSTKIDSRNGILRKLNTPLGMGEITKQGGTGAGSTVEGWVPCTIESPAMCGELGSRIQKRSALLRLKLLGLAMSTEKKSADFSTRTQRN